MTPSETIDLCGSEERVATQRKRKRPFPDNTNSDDDLGTKMAVNRRHSGDPSSSVVVVLSQQQQRQQVRTRNFVTPGGPHSKHNNDSSALNPLDLTSPYREKEPAVAPQVTVRKPEANARNEVDLTSPDRESCKPEPRVVPNTSARKPMARALDLLAPLSDSDDDDDDDVLFLGTGSVFAKNRNPSGTPNRNSASNAKLASEGISSDGALDVKPSPEEIGSSSSSSGNTPGNNRNESLRTVLSAAERKPAPEEIVSSSTPDTDQKAPTTKAEPTPEQIGSENVLSIPNRQQTPKIKESDWNGHPIERRRHLNGLDKALDRALQLLLWEIGFTYNVYAHQFEAIRFVAGLVPTFPVPMGYDDSYWAKFGPILTNPDAVGAQYRSDLLNTAQTAELSESTSLTLPTRGMLLADEMGLGKTIEALAGAALRKAMLEYSRKKNGDNNLPTLIVSPQDGIQNQWYETLVKSGVDPSSIEVWGDTKAQRKKRQDASGHDISNPSEANGHTQSSYILCTRYNIQSELRKLFNLVGSAPDSGCIDINSASLFRGVPWNLVVMLRNQYRADKGKETNKYNHTKEKAQDCVARLIQKRRTATGSDDEAQFAFQTIIVDEAHFCKNVLAYWGLGLALLGRQSKRTVLLTGTPYNNGPSDMSALMTYIDPSQDAARLGWWENAVGSSSNAQSGSGHHRNLADAVGQWRKAYLLRRTKDVLLLKLPPRHKTVVDVGALPSELWIYETYEGKFLSALRKLRNNMEATTPEARHRAKKVFEMMMACMACMRMALVHPVLPGGREMTIHFSPSRRHLLKREERPNKCVFCNSDPTKEAEKDEARKTAGAENRHGPGGDHFRRSIHDNDDEDDGLLALAGTARTEMDLDDDQLDDDDFEGDYEAKSKRERELEERKKGPIVPLGPEFCLASGSRCQHYAHTKCIEAHQRGNNIGCPRCHDLSSRMHQKLSHTMYCKDVCTHIDGANTGGFTASAKIEEATKWFETTVPKNEKAIFLSFFKGSLDLIEGILVSKFGIECARYDGDVSKELRTSDLQRFKTSSTCRVLLATVQSGGTGLNITEANHICFLDRWFNPCVHDQAESRCHRIGQTKDVNVAYLDINFTIDVVMKRINVLKEGNASVILADGTSLGDRWSLGYRNVSGVIGNTLNALLDLRDQTIKSNGDAPLPPYVEHDLEIKMAETAKMNAKLNVKSEEKERKFIPQTRTLPTPTFLTTTPSNPFTKPGTIFYHHTEATAGGREYLERLRKQNSSVEYTGSIDPAMNRGWHFRLDKNTVMLWDENNQRHRRDNNDYEAVLKRWNTSSDNRNEVKHVDTRKKIRTNTPTTVTSGSTRPAVFPPVTRPLTTPTIRSIQYTGSTDPAMNRGRSYKLNDKAVMIWTEHNQSHHKQFFLATDAVKDYIKRDKERIERKRNQKKRVKQLERKSIGAASAASRAPKWNKTGFQLPKKSLAPTSATARALPQPPRKPNRFASGLSSIVSQKRRTKEFLRQKKRGDL